MDLNSDSETGSHDEASLSDAPPRPRKSTVGKKPSMSRRSRRGPDQKEGVRLGVAANPEGKTQHQDPGLPASNAQTTEEQTENAVGESIAACLHRIWDIETAARTFVPIASKLLLKEAKGVSRQLREGQRLLDDSRQSSQVAGMKSIDVAIERLDRLKNSDVPAVLEIGLFLSLFSAFDAFSGAFLSATYRKKPDLFSRLSRSIAIGELLSFNSFHEVKEAVLQAEIERFRRNSYVDQFEELEMTFGIKLKGFTRWPDFVECSQRRNLLTHADGVVSDQYLRICRKEGCTLQPTLKTGDRLELTASYFLKSCALIAEVVFKLGQTLWRKLFPEELADADAYLNRTVYSRLRARDWQQAQVFGEFAVSMPKASCDLERRLGVINYAIALKFGGDPQGAGAVLQKHDWSATLNEFKLAEAVLLDHFEKASEIMLSMGKQGEILREESYHTWPLFTAFREDSRFLETYEKIYGYPFVAEVQRTADQAREETQETIARRETQTEREASLEVQNPESTSAIGDPFGTTLVLGASQQSTTPANPSTEHA